MGRPRPASGRFGMERLEERAMMAVSVLPQAETASASAADDIAIWISPTDPSKSTIIGTAKTSSSSLRVYNLDGEQIQTVNASKVNNVDLRYNFELGGERISILTGTSRSNNSIVVYKINEQTGMLENIAARNITTGIGVYGSGMYLSPFTGKYYTYVTSEKGEMQQWELFDNGAGKVDAKLVRSFNVGSITEGVVADDVTGVLYVGQEKVGIWRYSAEPDGGSTRTQLDHTGTGGHLKADVEGLAIYYRPDGTGYLIASSQGSNDFVVYRREGNNEYIGTFKIDATSTIDKVSVTGGIDLTNAALGSKFPQGMFVAQDNDQNFKAGKRFRPRSAICW